LVGFVGHGHARAALPNRFLAKILNINELKRFIIGIEVRI
jgi:hypothetical protein